MTRVFLSSLVVASFCLDASAQSTAPRFEAADVHVSAPSSNPRDNFAQGPFVGGGRFELRRATVVDLVRLGWGVQPDKIIGGPNWVGLDRFDILAKAPTGTTPADFRLMLQNLLADRLSLKVHGDTKPMPAFALVAPAGKKPRMKEADGTGESGCKGQNSASGEGTGRLMMSNSDGVVTQLSILPGGLVQYNCRNITMAAFVVGAQGFVGANLGPNPITDETGLKGAWDFDLKFSLQMNGGLMGPTPAERISFADAVDKQLGLKLEKHDVPMPITVIDTVNQTPEPSPAGQTLNLPALPTEFDVAEIKPTAPDFRGGMSGPQRGGRVNMRGLPLNFLIQQAWGLYSRDMIAGLPKSAENDRYDITAKAPTYGPEPDPVTGAGEGLRIQTSDQATINVMLRNLLIERFGIKFHFEERPTTAFVLAAVKPKLKKADPANRTGYHEGPGPDGKDPRISNPAAGRLVTCENMTMKQFAQNLAGIAGGYVQGATVYDETGLEGAFDFTLNFGSVGMVRGPVRIGPGGEGAPSAGPAEAADPTGAITLFDAMEKQLGLKLQQTKRPAQVLVIDHIEPKPAEN